MSYIVILMSFQTFSNSINYDLFYTVCIKTEALKFKLFASYCINLVALNASN